MGGLDHQIVALLQHFLNDALERTVVPDHLDLAIQSTGAVGFENVVEPFAALGNHPWRISSRSSTDSMAVISYEKS